MTLPTLFDLAARLIAEDTAGEATNLPLLDVVQDLLERAGFRCTRQLDGRRNLANLLAVAGPLDDDCLVLCGHTDVVPHAGQPGWSGDPLRLRREGDSLLGRGTSDMKVFLAQAVLAALETDLPGLRRGLALLFTYDEETESTGARRFARLLGTGPSLLPPRSQVLLGEPTDWRIYRGHKGYVRFSLTAHGKGGHSSRRAEGCNAVVWAARAAALIDDLAREERAALVPDELFGSEGEASVNVASLHGGLADNMIPEQAVLRVSYRPRPNQDPLAFLERVRKAVDEILLGPMKREARTGQLDIDLQYQGPGLLTEADTILEKALLSAGALGPAGAAPYSTDGGHLAGAGLRCLICGPGSLAQAHRADESISSAAFEQGVPFLRAVIREYCLTKRN